MYFLIVIKIITGYTVFVVSKIQTNTSIMSLYVYINDWGVAERYNILDATLFKSV